MRDVARYRIAVMVSTESVPTWLEGWRPGSALPVDDFFASRVVYYPGSGTDGQPVQVFGSRHAAHCFLFVNYGIPRSDIEFELSDAGHPFAGYCSVGRIGVSERELTPDGWVSHASPEGHQIPPVEVVLPFAFVEVLERKQGFDELHGP